MAQPSEWQPERYLELVRLWARQVRLDPRFQRRFGLSDVVQETMMKAHEKTVGFRGNSVASLQMVLAGVSFAGLLLVFLLLQLEGPEPLLGVALFSPYVALFAFYGFNRRWRRLPSSHAERQLWSVWIGHLLACAVVSVAFRATAGAEYSRAIWTALPAYAALTGFGFFVMGSTHWGYHYMFGLASFGIGALMPFLPEATLLAFALLVGGANLMIGLDLRKMAGEMAEGNPASRLLVLPNNSGQGGQVAGPNRPSN